MINTVHVLTLPKTNFDLGRCKKRQFRWAQTIRWTHQLKKFPPSQNHSSSDKTTLHLPCLIQPTDLQSYHWCPLWYLSLATGHTLCKINKHKNKQIKNQWVSVYQNPEDCKWLPFEHLTLFPRLMPLTSVKFSLHWPATSLCALCGCFNVKALEPSTFLFIFIHRSLRSVKVFHLCHLFVAILF